jgi:hypothetical protein
VGLVLGRGDSSAAELAAIAPVVLLWLVPFFTKRGSAVMGTALACAVLGVVVIFLMVGAFVAVLPLLEAWKMWFSGFSGSSAWPLLFLLLPVVPFAPEDTTMARQGLARVARFSSLTIGLVAVSLLLLPERTASLGHDWLTDPGRLIVDCLAAAALSSLAWQAAATRLRAMSRGGHIRAYWSSGGPIAWRRPLSFACLLIIAGVACSGIVAAVLPYGWLGVASLAWGVACGVLLTPMLNAISYLVFRARAPDLTISDRAPLGRLLAGLIILVFGSGLVIGAIAIAAQGSEELAGVLLSPIPFVLWCVLGGRREAQGEEAVLAAQFAQRRKQIEERSLELALR